MSSVQPPASAWGGLRERTPLKLIPTLGNRVNKCITMCTHRQVNQINQTPSRPTFSPRCLWSPVCYSLRRCSIKLALRHPLQSVGVPHPFVSRRPRLCRQSELVFLGWSEKIHDLQASYGPMNSWSRAVRPQQRREYILPGRMMPCLRHTLSYSAGECRGEAGRWPSDYCCDGWQVAASAI